MESPSSKPPMGSPMPLHAAAERLARAADRDEILEILVTYGAQFFDFFAVFAVQHTFAQGKIARGADTMAGAYIHAATLDLKAFSVFRELIRDLQPRIIDLNLSEANRNAVQNFPRLDFQPALLVPIYVRRRAVLLAYGDRSGHDLRMESFSKLLAFTAHVGNALETLILRQKLRASMAPPKAIEHASSMIESPSVEKVPPADVLYEAESFPDETLRDMPAVSDVPVASAVSTIKKPEQLVRDTLTGAVFEHVESLVGELSACSPEEVDATIAIALTEGPAVLPELMRRFPGALWFNRHQKYTRLARGRDVSAIARTFVAFGAKADPYITTLLDPKSDDEARYYAVLVAADLGHTSLIAPLARLLFDHDTGIRNIALDVLVEFRGAKELERLLEPVRAVAQSAGEAPARRRIAVRALGELHDSRAVKLLISLLSTDEPALVQAALRALTLLTHQDFGNSKRRWAAWYARHGRKSRLEWLLDALLHEDEGLRSAAFDEVLRQAGHTFGYNPAASKKERKIAQKKLKKHFSCRYS